MTSAADPDFIRPGVRVIWRYVGRGGYKPHEGGFYVPVDAEVVRVGPKRVLVRVRRVVRRDGERVEVPEEKWVSRESLARRKKDA